MKRLQSRGFTIIELLIATVVFSVILLVITAAIVQFGRLYYRSIVQGRTQEIVRNVNTDVAQALQFSGNGNNHVDHYGSAGSAEGYCIGRLRYRFTQGGATPHSLIRDTLNANQPCNGGTSTGAEELLGANNMWLSEMTITRLGNYDGIGSDTDSNLYTITVRVAYAPLATDLSADKKSCLVGINLGGQFCGVSDLTTTVNKR